MRDHAGLVAFGQQPGDRLAADGAEIERPLVDVHLDELVGLRAVEPPPETHGVAERLVAVLQAVLDALAQQAMHVADRLDAKVLADRVGAQAATAGRCVRTTTGPCRRPVPAAGRRRSVGLRGSPARRRRGRPSILSRRPRRRESGRRGRRRGRNRRPGKAAGRDRRWCAARARQSWRAANSSSVMPAGRRPSAHSGRPCWPRTNRGCSGRSGRRRRERSRPSVPTRLRRPGG